MALEEIPADKENLRPEPKRFPIRHPGISGPEAKSDAPSLLRCRQHGLIRVDQDFVRARRRREPESRFVAIGEHPA